MITYSDIYEATRKERYSDQIQPLPKNFVVEVSAYLQEKKQLSLKDDEILSDMITKTKKQLENAITLFRELIIRRRKKILNLILIAAETGISKQDFENMLPFEKTLFEELMKSIEISDKKITEVLSNKKFQESKNELVLFNEKVGEFLDIEGEKIGPFEKGQIANLPREVAKILVEDGKAEFFEK
ncbi:DNA replication complex GINS family protein [Candidatus Pacearchaeota archaeon]|nr:DNA replication complex GINS family protein [Candidatus Pacearchaeota archaeon]